MSRTVDTWEEATRIFGEARELAATDRAAYLDRSCGPGGRLRAAVERLLAGDVADSFLAPPPWGETLAAGTPPDLGLREGEVLNDRYRIDRALASGGQADVYLAFDTRLARTVVVKAMRATGAASALLRQRFEREMQALLRIEHPGVVGILDVGALPGGAPFLVVQHVDGITLRERLRQARLAPAAAADIVRQLGAALRAAHASGVVHGDLKPENVIVKEESDDRFVVRLIDFGMARVEHPDLRPGMTLMIAGTVRYMAPEQFEGENSIASDTYSLARVACEMLWGQPDSRGMPKEFGGVTRRLLDSALAFRPKDRPQDVQRWSEELSSSLLRSALPRRRRIRAAAIVASVALLAAAGVRYLPQFPSEPRRSIEKIGAFDPLEEGFQIHNELRGMVADNPARTGYDGWRAATPRMGHYFRNLTPAEKRVALQRGWKLTTTMRLEEGLCFAVIDFRGVGKRYDIQLRRAGADDVVRLQTQIVPASQGIDLLLPHDADGYHTYELRYDPGLQVADLWIDGAKRLTGYRGHSQFQVDGDLLFGVAVFESARGVATFQHVRFELDP